MTESLSTKQRAFIEHYLACWNASEAARRAGYSERTAGQIGFENLKKPEIADAITQRLTELQMSADEVLTRLTEHARGSAEDFLTIERVKRRDMQAVPDPTDEHPEGVKFVPGPEYEVVETRLDFEKAKLRGKLHLIKEFKDGKDGLSVKLYDAQAALALLGKHHGLFIERQEITGKDGEPLVKVYAGFDPDKV